MKKALFFICVLASLANFAQAPQKINYQAVVRNSSGVPLANTPATLSFTISNTGGSYSESVTVVSNAVGLVTHAIGGGTPISGSMASISWALNPTNLSVSVDVGAGPVFMGTQQLVSVPYALYAETSGSGSGPTYSASSNVSISASNILDLTNTTVSPGAYGANIAPNSNIPMFTVDPKGRLTSAGQYAANTSGDITGTLDNQTVNKIKGVPLSATSPTIGQILAYNGASWTPFTPTLSASGPWQQVGGTIIENTITDVVGIGTASPSNKLDIATSGTFTANDEQIVSLGSGNALQIFKIANSGCGIFLSMGTTNASTAVAIGHPGAGYGLTVDVATNNAIAATSTGSIATISAQNKTGPGPAIKGFKTGTAVAGPVAVFDQSGGFTSEVVLATTTGDGAAVRAVGNATVAGSTPLSLLVENGHIKAVGPPVSVATSPGTGITVTSSSALAGSNDVKGVISINASGSGMVANSTLDMTVTFNRNYATAPRVVVTPISNLQQFAYYISSTTAGQFTLRMYIPAGATLNPVASQLFEFNYMVIE